MQCGCTRYRCTHYGPGSFIDTPIMRDLIMVAPIIGASIMGALFMDTSMMGAAIVDLPIVSEGIVSALIMGVRMVGVPIMGNSSEDCSVLVGKITRGFD